MLAAPYAEGTVLTLTGDVDFEHSVGRAEAVTTFPDGRPPDERTLFFTAQDIWFGGVPGLGPALTGAGLPPASFVRRPLSTTAPGGTASLVDVGVQMVPRLATPSSEDPRSYLDRDYTWAGQRSINGQLATVYASGRARSVAVADPDGVLLQYGTRLPDQTFAITVTLSDHGPRQISLPAAADTLDAAAHPDVAGKLGV